MCLILVHEFGPDIMNLDLKLHEFLIVAKGSRLSGFIFTLGHALVEGHLKMPRAWNLAGYPPSSRLVSVFFIHHVWKVCFSGTSYNCRPSAL